ncbi:uncharacterized protein LOC107026459 isoform X1 [Solanum pennellii]|uniref:Uncharacterized protein LOC107026459 isoform X1 n=1 Tax=Solanum pennellii TaxID=28526 RepID=A0ABM1VFB3_SOLPN|nr:uncharacterized protein LOC107026459 isoform X1 [Solanum pennellii]
MRNSFLFFSLIAFFIAYLQFQVHAAAPAGPLIKHLNSILKWSRSTSKTPQSDGNFLQFEEGYLVETVVEGNELGVVPYKIRVSEDGELFAVDAINSKIVRITPPLSQYSRARLVAGSFQGHTGHVDGKPSDARFKNPKGATMDDKGNIYVADTSNLAIRKIGEAGVTTIAGGKSNVPGYRDGPSEDAQFSSDFDVIYVRPTCSLLVVDRGNAALRQISLSQEDCDYQYSSVSTIDVLMVIGAIIIGYAACMLQQGFGSKTLQQVRMEVEQEEPSLLKEKPTPVVETVKDEQEAGWPSFGQLLWDLAKLAIEGLGSLFGYAVPLRYRPKSFIRPGLTPLKDSLIMPEDEVEPPLVQKQRAPLPASEIRHVPAVGDKVVSEGKPTKIRSSSSKDPNLSTKHRSSRRHEYAEYYGASGEVPSYVHVRSKSQKERTKHRRHDSSVGAAGVETKPADQPKAVNYEDPKFAHYSMRNKYGDSFPRYA